MNKLYYCNENDEYISSAQLLKEYKDSALPFQTEGESFSEYIESCMAYNNGSLYTIEQREGILKRKLAKLNINEYSIDEAVNLIMELQRLYEFRERNGRE